MKALITLRKKGTIPTSATCLENCVDCRFKFRCFSSRRRIVANVRTKKEFTKLTGGKEFTKAFKFGEWVLINWADREPEWFLVCDYRVGAHEDTITVINERRLYPFHVPYNLVIKRGIFIKTPDIPM